MERGLRGNTIENKSKYYIANQHMQYLNQFMHDNYHLQRKALRDIYERLA